MQIILLGIGAGGGVPQWNCGCTNCRAARAQGRGRTQSCEAVSADGERWVLLNASPDLPVQLAAHAPLWPPAMRESRGRGVVLTDGEIDHTLGLMLLPERTFRLPVYAPNGVAELLAGPCPSLASSSRIPESTCGGCPSGTPQRCRRRTANPSVCRAAPLGWRDDHRATPRRGMTTCARSRRASTCSFNRLTQVPRDAEYALGLVVDRCVTRERQDRAVAALNFKCDVLWSLLDAVEQGKIPDGES